GSLGFTAVLLTMTLPAAAACYALGGTGGEGGIAGLYVVLIVASLQLTTLALLVSSRAQSSDGALRASYALVLALCVLTLVPQALPLLRGGSGLVATLASWLRSLSPVPAVMETLGQSDVLASGLSSGSGLFQRYLVVALLFSVACAAITVAGLNHKLFDRARA